MQHWAKIGFIVRIRVSTSPCQASHKLANCSSPSFLGNPPLYWFFVNPPPDPPPPQIFFCYKILFAKLLLSLLCRFCKMELLHRYFLRYFPNLKYNLFQKGGLIFFFSFVSLFVCFFLFRLLKFLFQYFTLIRNPPDLKNSIKNITLNIKTNIFKF